MAREICKSPLRDCIRRELVASQSAVRAKPWRSTGLFEDMKRRPPAFQTRGIFSFPPRLKKRCRLLPQKEQRRSSQETGSAVDMLENRRHCDDTARGRPLHTSGSFSRTAPVPHLPAVADCLDRVRPRSPARHGPQHATTAPSSRSPPTPTCGLRRAQLRPTERRRGDLTRVC